MRVRIYPHMPSRARLTLWGKYYNFPVHGFSVFLCALLCVSVRVLIVYKLSTSCSLPCRSYVARCTGFSFTQMAKMAKFFARWRASGTVMSCQPLLGSSTSSSGGCIRSLSRDQSCSASCWRLLLPHTLFHTAISPSSSVGIPPIRSRHNTNTNPLTTEPHFRPTHTAWSPSAETTHMNNTHCRRALWEQQWCQSRMCITIYEQQQSVVMIPPLWAVTTSNKEQCSQSWTEQ